MRRKQGPVIISQCSKNLQQTRQLEKDMVIRMEQLWIKKRGEVNECN